jgi:hypothetical protein
LNQKLKSHIALLSPIGAIISREFGEIHPWNGRCRVSRGLKIGWSLRRAPGIPIEEY